MDAGVPVLVHIGTTPGPHVVAESWITRAVKRALPRNPSRQASPAARVRARTRDRPESELTAEEEPPLLSSVRQKHAHLCRPSDHALVRATRVSGGSTAAVRAALHRRCDGARVNAKQTRKTVDAIISRIQWPLRLPASSSSWDTWQPVGCAEVWLPFPVVAPAFKLRLRLWSQ